MGKGLKFLGFTIGAVTAAYVVTKLLKQNCDFDSDDISRFDELIDKQTVVDELDGNTLLNWYKNYSGKKENVFFLARVTEQTAAMFALGRVPSDLDTDHCLLQTVVRKENESYIPVKVRLVSFATMKDDVEQILDGKEYIMITEDE